MGLLQRLRTLFETEARQDQPEEQRSLVDLKRLAEELRVSISTPRLFIEALTHRSYVVISGNDSLTSNERLEFLGDAVLNLVVAEYLFLRHQVAPEGDLTKIRARLVNRKALVGYARRINLEHYLLRSLSPSTIGERGMDNLLADGFEAIIAAIYLDCGYERARQFIERQVLMAIQDGTVNVVDENFKSRLLEYAQAQGLGVPRYIILHEEGPDHDRTFTIAVQLRGLQYGTGKGKNKKDAEQTAAAEALQKLNLI